jgi:HAD superfamily hydrolase (TIGR01549 family)
VTTRFDAVLFDMDGVILEGPRTHPDVYDRAADCAADALDLEPTVDQRETLRAYSYSAVETVCAAFGADPAEFWRRKEAEASRLTAERVRRGERAIYDDVDVLSALGERTTLALVSNNRDETARFVADYVSAPFEAARGRDPTAEGWKRRKPAPDYLLETMAALDVEEGVYVGDRETDVLAAERAGLEPAYLRRSHNADAPLPDGTRYELETLADLFDLSDL